MNTLSEQNSHLLLDAQRGDERAFEQMIQDNSGLIWSIVRRFFGRGVEPDDLYQLGCLGFFKAVQGFDSAYGTQFSTYAVPKIAGEIKRFLRDDGTVKVSRSIKERSYKISRATQELQRRLGREPFLSEIAEETGYAVEEIAESEQASRQVYSLDAEINEDGGSLIDILTNEGEEENMVENIDLFSAINQLEELPRQVLALRFFRDMTQQKTAQILGISQVQVSRMERRAIEQIRSKMVQRE